MNGSIIAIGHFEDVQHFKDTAPSVVTLGRISSDPLTDRFRIFLAVSRSSVALRIMEWNGREKILLSCASQAAKLNEKSQMPCHKKM